MPRKSTKKTIKPVRPQLGDGVETLNAGSVLEDPITRTLENPTIAFNGVRISLALPSSSYCWCELMTVLSTLLRSCNTICRLN